MTLNPTDSITVLEERLARAMQHSDAEALDELLADDLVFTNHEGRLVSKQDDLGLHRSGLLKIDTLQSSERAIQRFGDVAVVTLRLRLAGRHADNAFQGTFRFTRVWALREDRWQVVAAHSSVAAA